MFNNESVRHGSAVSTFLMYVYSFCPAEANSPRVALGAEDLAGPCRSLIYTTPSDQLIPSSPKHGLENMDKKPKQDWFIELRFYVPLDKVISETFFPANLLAQYWTI